MAIALSKVVNIEEYQLLRSIYFDQSIPSTLASQPSGIVALLELLKNKGLIVRASDRFKLTRAGLSALRRYVGTYRIPMIDLDPKYIVDETADCAKFEIRSPLARQLLKRVSNDE